MVEIGTIKKLGLEQLLGIVDFFVRKNTKR